MPPEIASNEEARQHNANKKKQLKENYEQLEYESQFDRETLDKLRALQSAKEHAERDEDYGEAKKLKEAIEKLKLVGTQISKLEERKEIAVRNEDYDSAMIIKREIEKLKNAVFAPVMAMNSQPGYNENPNNHRGMNNQKQGPPMYNQGQEERPLNNNNFQGNRPNPKMDQYNNMNKSAQGNYELENDSSIINKSQQNYGYNDNQNEERAMPGNRGQDEYGNVQQSMEQDRDMNRANMEEMNKPYDEQVIPTMAKGGGNNKQFEDEMGGLENGQGNDDMPDEAEEIAADQISIFFL